MEKPFEQVPVLQLDYCFPKMAADASALTVLTLIDEVYLWVWAIVCSQKGPDDRFVLQVAVRHVRMLGFPKISIRCDPEASTLAFTTAMCQEISTASPQSSPKGSKGSLGLVERAHLTVTVLARTMLADVAH